MTRILLCVVCLCLCFIADGLNGKKIKILSSMTICLKSSEISQKHLSKLLANIDSNYEIYVLRPTCCNETIKYQDKKIHLIEFDSVAPYTDFRRQINHYNIAGWLSLLAQNCRNLLSNKSIINELQQIAFDFSIVQLWDGCGFIISDLLHLKRIDFVIQGLMYPQLNKIYDFVYFDAFEKKIIPKSGSDVTFEILVYFPLFDEIRSDFGISVKTQLDSFRIYTQFVWVPEIPGYEYPNYLVPRIQFIGPIRSQLRLDSNSADTVTDCACIKWLDSLSPNANVIFFSFGTLWLDMPQLKHRDVTIMKAVLSILSQDSYYIIMKSLKSTYFSREMEVSITKQYDDKIRIYNQWIPQKQILSHGKVKVLVFHGGIGTLQEAMFYGVPMVSIPFEYDQPLNMEKAERIGIAYPALDVSSFTAQQLINGIDTVLNEQYSEKAKVWANAMKIYDATHLIKWCIYCVVNNISASVHLPSYSIKLKMTDEMNGNSVLLAALACACIILLAAVLLLACKKQKKIHTS